MQVLQKKNVLLQLPKNHVLILLQKKQVVNMCANNYLGLSDNSELISAAKESYDKWGFGLSSVRFICGTQQIHKTLEKSHQQLFRYGRHNIIFFLF